MRNKGRPCRPYVEQSERTRTRKYLDNGEREVESSLKSKIKECPEGGQKLGPEPKPTPTPTKKPLVETSNFTDIEDPWGNVELEMLACGEATTIEPWTATAAECDSIDPFFV